jgi:hypothetical protein
MIYINFIPWPQIITSDDIVVGDVIFLSVGQVVLLDRYVCSVSWTILKLKTGESFEMSILRHVPKDWNPKQRHRDKRKTRSGDQLQ